MCVIAISKSRAFFLLKVRRLYSFFPRRRKGFDFDESIFFHDVEHYLDCNG